MLLRWAPLAAGPCRGPAARQRVLAPLGMLVGHDRDDPVSPSRSSLARACIRTASLAPWAGLRPVRRVRVQQPEGRTTWVSALTTRGG